MAKKKTRRGSRHRSIVSGIILLGIGLLFECIYLDLLPYIGNSWPLILVIVGFALVVGAHLKDKPENPQSFDSPTAEPPSPE